MREYEVVSVEAWLRERSEAECQVRTVKAKRTSTPRKPKTWAECDKGTHEAPVMPQGAKSFAFAAHKYGRASRPWAYKNDVQASEHAPAYTSEAQRDRATRGGIKAARKAMRDHGKSA